jgi:hypothetical protein
MESKKEMAAPATKEINVNVKVTTKNNVTIVETPYNRLFVDKCHQLNGIWEGGKWMFKDLSSIGKEKLKKYLVKYYGTDGTFTPDLVDIHVFDLTDSRTLRGIEVYGRSVCFATGRDYGAHLADGIEMLSGSIDSGGSRKYWETHCTNLEFVMKGVPRIYLKKNKELQEDLEKHYAEVIERN